MTGLLTKSLKLNRKKIEKTYKKELFEMFGDSIL